MRFTSTISRMSPRRVRPLFPCYYGATVPSVEEKCEELESNSIASQYNCETDVSLMGICWELVNSLNNTGKIPFLPYF